MKYWENGFHLSQNEKGTRYEITDEEWQALLMEQSNGKFIVSDKNGKPVAITKQPSERDLAEVRIYELKSLLSESDYKAIKFAEGELSAEEYEPIKQQRRAWREEINLLEKQIG